MFALEVSQLIPEEISLRGREKEILSVINISSLISKIVPFLLFAMDVIGKLKEEEGERGRKKSEEEEGGKEEEKGGREKGEEEERRREERAREEEEQRREGGRGGKKNRFKEEELILSRGEEPRTAARR